MFTELIELNKQCRKCKIEKPLDFFYKNRDGINAQCKECINARNAKWYLENKDKRNISIATWQIKNKNKINAASAKWKTKNRDKVRIKDADYSRKNPDKISAKTAKRKAAKLLATPSWADSEHVNSLYTIAAMSRKAGYDIHVDHIVPLRSKIVCGLHCEANLQLLPSSNNLIKGNRYWPDMW